MLHRLLLRLILLLPAAAAAAPAAASTAATAASNAATATSNATPNIANIPLLIWLAAHAGTAAKTANAATCCC